jgi:DNA-binding response OmpR family regulator
MRVLLIGSCQLLVKALRQGLQEERIKVDAFLQDEAEVDGQVAGEEHDAIVLELMRPEVAGWSRLRRWREDGLTTPVLVLTTATAMGARVLAQCSGANDWLPKPFDLTEFVERLRALARPRSRTRKLATPVKDFWS